MHTPTRMDTATKRLIVHLKHGPVLRLSIGRIASYRVVRLEYWPVCISLALAPLTVFCCLSPLRFERRHLQNENDSLSETG